MIVRTHVYIFLLFLLHKKYSRKKGYELHPHKCRARKPENGRQKTKKRVEQKENGPTAAGVYFYVIHSCNF